MSQSNASPSEYDLLLALMPLSLVFGVGASIVLSVSVAAGLVGGSVPAGGAIGYALFVEPPEGIEGE